MNPPNDYTELFWQVHAKAYKDKWDARLGLIVDVEAGLACRDPETDKKNWKIVKEAVALLSSELVRDAVMADQRGIIAELGQFLTTLEPPKRFNTPAICFGRHVCQFHQEHSRFPNPKELEQKIADSGESMSETTFHRARRELNIGHLVKGKVGRPKKDVRE